MEYLVKVNLSKANIMISVTTVIGNPKIFISTGLLKLKKKQKKSKSLVLMQIFKVIFSRLNLLENRIIVLQFKNVKTYYELFIIKLLKEKVFLKSIKSYNNLPFNGCRPKKIKRFKKRTKKIKKND